MTGHSPPNAQWIKALTGDTLTKESIPTVFCFDVCYHKTKECQKKGVGRKWKMVPYGIFSSFIVVIHSSHLPTLAYFWGQTRISSVTFD